MATRADAEQHILKLSHKLSYLEREHRAGGLTREMLAEYDEINQELDAAFEAYDIANEEGSWSR